MLTIKKMCDFIAEMGLLSEDRTHMVKEINVKPFEGKVSVSVVINAAGDCENYTIPVFDFGEEE